MLDILVLHHHNLLSQENDDKIAPRVARIREDGKKIYARIRDFHSVFFLFGAKTKHVFIS